MATKISKEEKERIVTNLKKYKKTGSKKSIGPEELNLSINAYDFFDILRIIMDGLYCVSTGEIIQRLIDLME